MRFIMSPLVLMALCWSLGEAKFYQAHHFNQYKAGMVPHHEQGKPTSRHKNHCAYVVEKTVSFTVQDGAAPFVKAEYNKCSWGQKCPTLLYRLMYKPLFKVAHKTVTELEWRCCPGYSGYGCMEGPPHYQAPMPPFKGPMFKGPQYKGPMSKGPMFKGPPSNPWSQAKGPPTNPMVKANPWSQPKGPPTGGLNSYPMRHFGPPASSSYPDAPFQPYPYSSPEPEPLPEPEQEPEPEPEPDHAGVHHEEHGPEHEHDHGQGPGEHIQEENLPASVGRAEVETLDLDSEREERIYRMEEEVQRLNQGLETLRGTVNGLEDSLRASLRDDANRMLSALLSAAPGPGHAPAPIAASNPSTVGFVEIPGEDPKTEGLDGTHMFPSLTELNGRVEELRKELQAKSVELHDLKAAVMEHGGELKKMSDRAAEGRNRTAVEKMLDGKLSAARTEILSGFEKRVESAESRCEEQAGDVGRQCRREQSERREEMEDALDQSTSDLRAEVRDLQAQLHALKSSGSCCDGVGGLGERVKLLEASVAGLNQSQGHLRAELGGHKDHMDGMIAGRLEYVEAKLNVTGQPKSSSSAWRGAVVDGAEAGRGLEARMEGKLRALEGRLLTALEELGNATAPALLEGHAVPTLETELESLRGRLEMDVDRVKKHLNSLEVLCSSSCPPPQNPAAIQADSAAAAAPDVEGNRLNNLNATLQEVVRRLSQREQQEEVNPPVQGQLTILRFSVRSVNRTLRDLQDSLGTVVHQVGQTNSSWHEREARLAQQMKGVVQLVGHQASMLGAGERRLTRLKGELQDMRRRLAQEVQGCRSTAMGVQKRVTEVGGRVANVEDQCKGLNDLAEDLERIRDELEKQSNGLLLQFNGTLSSHSQQLSELRDEVRNCTAKSEPEPRRGDTFTLH